MQLWSVMSWNLSTTSLLWELALQLKSTSRCRIRLRRLNLWNTDCVHWWWLTLQFVLDWEFQVKIALYTWLTFFFVNFISSETISFGFCRCETAFYLFHEVSHLTSCQVTREKKKNQSYVLIPGNHCDWVGNSRSVWRSKN